MTPPEPAEPSQPTKPRGHPHFRGNTPHACAAPLALQGSTAPAEEVEEKRETGSGPQTGEKGIGAEEKKRMTSPSARTRRRIRGKEQGREEETGTPLARKEKNN